MVEQPRVDIRVEEPTIHDQDVRVGLDTIGMIRERNTTDLIIMGLEEALVSERQLSSRSTEGHK